MGEVNVDRMLEQIDSRMLTEWQCYYALEPWGDERADWRAGNIASNILNVNRTEKSQKLWTPKDFMLTVEEEQPKAKPKGNSPETLAVYALLMKQMDEARLKGQKNRKS